MKINLENVSDIMDGVKAGVHKAMEIAEKFANDRLQKAVESVTVVYDGKAPLTAARNIYEYIRAKGKDVKLINVEEYGKTSLATSFGRVIIVGHHKTAKDALKRVPMIYDNCGMKFGYSQNLCVLRASRSALGRGEKGRRKFAGYYNYRMPFHEELAVQYGTPTVFGARDETRKSQYDLLWLEFVTRGLSEFLGIEEEEPASEKTENIAGKAAEDLVRQLEADKDMTFSIDDIAQNIYEQNESDGIKTLRTHLGDDIVITGVWGDAQNERQLDDSELLEGELSAVTFMVGCYTIRSAQRLYKKTDSELFPEGCEPAGPEDIAEFLELEEKRNTIVLCSYDERFHVTHEISAKHQSAAGEADPAGYQYICRARSSFSWSEEISFICTLKEEASVSDDSAVLFVLKDYTGSSFGVKHWYKLAPDGILSEYEVHPFDEDSFKASWKDADGIL